MLLKAMFLDSESHLIKPHGERSDLVPTPNIAVSSSQATDASFIGKHINANSWHPPQYTRPQRLCNPTS